MLLAAFAKDLLAEGLSGSVKCKIRLCSVSWAAAASWGSWGLAALGKNSSEIIKKLEAKVAGAETRLGKLLKRRKWRSMSLKSNQKQI